MCGLLIIIRTFIQKIENGQQAITFIARLARFLMLLIVADFVKRTQYVWVPVILWAKIWTVYFIGQMEINHCRCLQITQIGWHWKQLVALVVMVIVVCRDNSSINTIGSWYWYLFCLVIFILDYCEPNPCQNGGTCSNTGSGFTCKCTSDWFGTRCQNTGQFSI